MDRLINLPDFVSMKVDMLTAARQFKDAIDKNCRRMGMDPDWETNICLYKEYNSDSQSDKIIVVSFEAGPHDWGVSYSLGGYPKSYAWPSGNPNDWYLECYYGFDVMFSPLDHDKAPSFKSISLKPGPSENMRDKMDIVRI
jgi:hypothetical protein|tara:strand:+ start:135 stop:557 length:423 start_codon:yes stop_codon:yes gene_type:complete